MDQKKNFSNEEKEIFNSFISKYNIKYYEISTLSFFHFEKFFENLFKDDFTQITNSNIDDGEINVNSVFYIIILGSLTLLIIYYFRGKFFLNFYTNLIML